MEIKLKIATPEGYAESTLKRVDFKLLLLPFRVKIKEEYVNKKGDEIIWLLDVPADKYHKLLKRVAGYDAMLGAVLLNPVLQKVMKPGEDQKVQDLLARTKIEVIKKATADELVEAGKTRWQRIKDTWVRRK